MVSTAIRARQPERRRPRRRRLTTRRAGKRLVFLAECLGDLAAAPDVEVRRGDPVTELAGVPLAATWTPVPGFARRAAGLDVVETHSWPWLVRPARRPYARSAPGTAVGA